jgi:hypothetical protein
MTVTKGPASAGTHPAGPGPALVKPHGLQAGIEDFNLHGFRHPAINNWRLQGPDYFRIMKTAGHQTLGLFKYYNAVSQEALRSLAPEKNGSNGPQ